MKCGILFAAHDPAPHMLQMHRLLCVHKQAASRGLMQATFTCCVASTKPLCHTAFDDVSGPAMQLHNGDKAHPCQLHKLMLFGPLQASHVLPYTCSW